MAPAADENHLYAQLKEIGSLNAVSRSSIRWVWAGNVRETSLTFIFWDQWRYQKKLKSQSLT